MTDSPQKPILPEGYTKWWSLKISELTPEQQELKRGYMREYNRWRKAQKSQPPETTKQQKFPEGVRSWWGKPADELTQEQLEIRRRYYREERREYHNNYAKNVFEDAKKYRKLQL